MGTGRVVRNGVVVDPDKEYRIERVGTVIDSLILGGTVALAIYFSFRNGVEAGERRRIAVDNLPGQGDAEADDEPTTDRNED